MARKSRPRGTFDFSIFGNKVLGHSGACSARGFGNCAAGKVKSWEEVKQKDDGSVLVDRTLAEHTLEMRHSPNGLEQTQSNFHLFLYALKRGPGKHAEWRVFESFLFQGCYLIAFRPGVLGQPTIAWLD